MGKCKLSKSGKIRRAYCAVFYKAFTTVKILYSRIVDGALYVMSYAMSRRKAQLDYVASIYGKLAFTLQSKSPGGISCHECAGVFL